MHLGVKRALFFLLMITPILTAQDMMDLDEHLKEQAIKVYLDVSRRYEEFIKTEIQFVNYVRDRNQAQVYVMMSQHRTGAGGDEFTIHLIGQQNFESVNDTLKYVATQTATEDDVRRGIVRVLKMGLIPYVKKTPLAQYIQIDYQRDEDMALVTDKWNFWVFNVDVDWDLEGEEAREEYRLDATFSIDRVTPESKFALSLSNDYREEHFEFEEKTLTSIRRSRDIRGMYVKSLSPHWSAGGYANFNSSSYRNINRSISIGPAVEYNIFPYTEYTRREFRFLYRPLFTNVNYIEETIYEKTRETLAEQSLAATFELKEPWGSLSSTLEGSHYFHDVSKNKVDFYCNLNLQLFEGFSLDIFGEISMIRDQLSLPSEEATQEEILLRQKEIATDYEYFVSLGFRYTFGSIYSNVVNPRFGNGGRRRRF